MNENGVIAINGVNGDICGSDSGFSGVGGREGRGGGERHDLARGAGPGSPGATISPTSRFSTLVRLGCPVLSVCRS